MQSLRINFEPQLGAISCLINGCFHTLFSRGPVPELVLVATKIRRTIIETSKAAG